MSLHVESSNHALMAVGHLAAQMEGRVNQADDPVTLPTIPEWRDMWERALDTTRAQAEIFDGPPPTRTTGVDVHTSLVTQESVAEAMEQERPVVEVSDDDQDPESNNLIKLVECDEEGCHERIPASKGKIDGRRLCYRHEPKLDGDEFEPIEEDS